MKIIGFLKKMNLVRIITVGITLFVVVTLTSNSLISTTLNNISKKQFSNLEVKEPSIGFEPSAGLAPHVAVNNSDLPTVSLPFGAIMRGYIVNSSIYNEGLCHFEVDNPEDIIYLNDTESDDFLSGGTGGSDGYWYACENSTGALWEIDPDNGDMTYIGGGGIGLNGLAHDITTNIMYGASGSDLYMVDVETGEQELIGYFGNDVIEMIGIAVDYEGNMFGWDLGDKLWHIDEQTGEATEIGPLGIDLNYAQDGGFYWNDDILFLTAFTMSPNYGSYLYACDPETGECSLIGQLEGNSQITASVVSLGWCCYYHDIGVEDIISPNDGNAWGEVEVIVKVKNYGDLPEEDIPINVVILKDGVDEEYNETVYVDIDWEETLYVEMPVWTPDDWQSVSNEYIDYKVVANADLYGDENPDNDYMEKWIELYFSYLHDVGCTGITGPKSGPAQTFQLNASIKNFGQYDECCFKTYVEIAEVDLSSSKEVFSYNFPSCNPWPPIGWSSTDSNWRCSNSSYAGGTAPELIFYYYPISYPHTYRFSSPAIDTSDHNTVEIEFKQRNSYSYGNYEMQVQTSQDGNTWDTVWSASGAMGPETVTLLTNENVGSVTFYISFVVQTFSNSAPYWYVDDILINGYTTFDLEYEDYQCITTIKPGEEKELELDDWTPDFLQYETTGTKIYLVKAWTDMISPPDENFDNDLFSEFITLEFFHDVGIKEIISPPPRGSDTYDKCWYAFDCSSYCCVRWCESGVEILSCHGNVFYQGGTFVEDEWWICDTMGNIWIIDTNTGYGTYVGNSSTGELVGLAYHEKSKILYGCSTQNLYTIDMDTGSATYIGPFQQLGYYMISLDCDRDGTMYGYDLNYAQSRTYIIDLETGNATPIGLTGVNMMYGQDMAYDYNNGIMYACVFNYNTFMGELRSIDLETGKFTYLGLLSGGAQYTCFAIPYILPFPAERYVPLSIQDIDVIVENIGTFPELDLACYAEIYEYITNCTNGTLVYETNITDIDLNEPLGGNKTLKFDSYNFTTEGLYGLFLNITDEDDDYPNNNELILGIGADGTPPVSNHTLDPETPDGENDWYVSDVEITICAEDPSIGCRHPGSGVKEIRVSINGNPWQVYEVECVTIIIGDDGSDILIEYYAIDNVGNEESIKSFNIQRDHIKPNIYTIWETYKKNFKWHVRFSCEATDSTSGLDRVEMYINEDLHEVNNNPDGTIYDFIIKWLDEFNTSNFKFIAFDKAGNSAFSLIEGSDIKSYNSKNIYFKHYYKICTVPTILRKDSIVAVISAASFFKGGLKTENAKLFEGKKFV